MKKKLLATILLASQAHAVTIPHTFTSGTSISSSEMNNNFTTLANDLNSRVSTVTAVAPLMTSGSSGAISIQLQDSSITTTKLAADAVTTIKIQNGTIENSDISLGASIDWTKINKAGATAADIGAVSTLQLGDGANKIPILGPLGFLGIGLPSAEVPLHIHGTSSTSGISLQSSGAPNNLGLGIEFNSNNGSIGNSRVARIVPFISSIGGGDLRFQISSDNIGYTDQMILTRNGLLGLGTLTPTHKISIRTPDPSGPFSESLINFKNASNVYSGLLVGYKENFATFMNTENTKMTFGTNSLERVVITGNGDVGIGTATPSARLQVGGVSDGTNALANAWDTLSDERLKKDFQKVSLATEKLLKLTGYFYFWKNGKDKSRQMGVKAQEVEKVFPEVVSTGSDGYKAVTYGHLIAPVIEAIKELHLRISSLENSGSSRLPASEKLQSKLNALESENKLMKAYLCQKDASAPFCK